MVAKLSGLLRSSETEQWARFGEGVRTRLSLSTFVVFGVARFGGRLVQTFVHASGAPQDQLKRVLDGLVSRAGFQRLGADPVGPERASWAELERLIERAPGLSFRGQLRLRVATEASMLGWLAAHRESPHAAPAEATALLEKLKPAIARRLIADAHHRHAPLTTATLEAAFASSDAPVVLTNLQGEPVLLNAVAERLWAEGPSFRDAVREAARGRRGPFRTTVIDVEHAPRHVLLVHRGEGLEVSLAARQVQAVRDWGLTPRETEVLALVVRGHTNQEIRNHLHCAERTVEVHITRLLGKALAENRATLIARFWTGERA